MENNNSVRAVKILIVLITICIFILIYMVLFMNENKVYENEEKNNDLISIMLETSQNSGDYEQSEDSSWPSTDRYEFNSTLSYCENGSKMTWDESTNSITVNVSVTDSCWVYFNIIPPDVTVKTNNTNASIYNASAPATLSCTDATSSYNQQYQAIEISDITSKYTSCTLNYSTPSSKTYINDYVTSLVGTEQGDGEVVEEDAIASDYYHASAISQSGYGTTSQYSSSSDSDTSGTSGTFWSFSDGVWTSDASSMTAGTYYHLSTTVQEGKYYQVCYTMTTGHNNNALYVYIDGEIQSIGSVNDYAAAYGLISRSECVDLGYIESGSEVQFIQYAYSGTNYGVVTMTVYLNGVDPKNVGSSGIRYEGKDPDNYVWFNNELWRIIGVFDESSHGVSGKNLTKIIRAYELDSYTWNVDGTNDWSTSSLNKLLNEYYYNSLDGTNSGYCYGYSNVISKSCDYTVTGISNSYRDMIENVTWYLGQYGNATTAGGIYNYERTAEYLYAGNSATTTGYVGLMYASDYAYSVLSSVCSRTTGIGSYLSSGCASESWIYGVSYEWLINSYHYNNTYAFSILHAGWVQCTFGVAGALAVRPVLYLSESVYIISGSGTESDPYIIGM